MSPRYLVEILLLTVDGPGAGDAKLRKAVNALAVCCQRIRFRHLWMDGSWGSVSG